MSIEIFPGNAQLHASHGPVGRHAAALDRRPRIEGPVEAFGWDRVAFGSKIPIETMAGTCAQLIATLGAVIGTASPIEQDRFYAENARRCYRL